MSELIDMAEPVESDTTGSSREAELEDRIRKLEAALESRPATIASQDDVANRVIEKLRVLASESRTLSEADRVLVLDTPSNHGPLALVAPPPPHGAVLRPVEPPGDPARHSWFFTQLFAEMRLAVRMYLDRNYRVSHTTQFALPAIALILAFNYFLLGAWIGIPVVSPLLERLVAVLLGIIGYKILLRELTRYREVLEYLSRYGR